MAGLYNGHILEFPQIRVDCFTSPPSNGWLIPCPLPSRTSPRTTSSDKPVSSYTFPAPLSLNAATTSDRPQHSPYHNTFTGKKRTIPSRKGKEPATKRDYITAPPAQLFLLTHVHSDHLVGLTSNFTGRIICTPDTKRMLLRLEGENDRVLREKGITELPRLRFPGLGARRLNMGKKGERIVDLIETIPYGDPKYYDLGYDSLGQPITVTITALDANHCPGSAMFLIKSRDRAVLHTGDIRADGPFLQALRTNSALEEFLPPDLSAPSSEKEIYWGKRILDRMYLDTSAMLGTGDMPDRDPTLRDLVLQMSLYPSDTVFFLNAWCFGWEGAIKAIARYFRTPIHVDRYKRSIYSAVETDPFLLACTTNDPNCTRFHACERKVKCVACRTYEGQNRVWNIDKRIVHVNFVEIKSAEWDMRHKEFLERLSLAAVGETLWPLNIESPIARHSTLPELQSLVETFQPSALSPNALIPSLKGLDMFLFPTLFGHTLEEGGIHNMNQERDAWMSQQYPKEYLHSLKAEQERGLLRIPENGEENEWRDCLPGEGSVSRGRGAERRRQMSSLGLTHMSSSGLNHIDKKEDEEEWDTEEEKEKEKGIRNRISSQSNSNSSCKTHKKLCFPETKQEVVVPLTIVGTSDQGTIPPSRKLKRMKFDRISSSVSIQAVDIHSRKSSDIKSEQIVRDSIKMERTKVKRGRFSVDRTRLRALMADDTRQ
ncbi:hypothetical protein M231_05970 [Tremella mesenterica]|uniref:Metallo-beta-lactamase domain-containing protein n=1 Tax=Tremella mesenterica TaxID=5217 RepID=A0A4Q1BGN6_TREME|nr:hypothetical protein M231_05970 [Tremella mesenterica]